MDQWLIFETDSTNCVPIKYFNFTETAKENVEVIYEFTRLSHMYGVFLYLTISSTWSAFMFLSLVNNVQSLVAGAYARIISFPSE